MISSRLFRIRNVGLLVLLLLLTSVVYGFAAANTFPEGAPVAGVGETPIVGTEITNIRFTMSAGPGGPQVITDVSFTAGADIPFAEVSLGPGGDWYSCVKDGAFDWDCDVSAGNYTSANRTSLQVATWQ